LQAGAGPFALRIWVVWEVCNASSLFGSSDKSGHGPEKTSKNFQRVNWCLAPGAGARFASIPIRDHKGAWHRVRGAGFASIPIRDHKGAWHRVRHRVRRRDLPAFRFGITKVPG